MKNKAIWRRMVLFALLGAFGPALLGAGPAARLETRAAETISAGKKALPAEDIRLDETGREAAKTETRETETRETETRETEMREMETRGTKMQETETQGTETQAATLTWESPVFLNDGSRYRPKQELEQDGKRFRLVSERLETAVKEGEFTWLTASIPYRLEGRQEPPETAVVAAIDEASGTEYEREVPRLEIREKETVWSDDFSFPVTVSGYGADSFYLGETEIPADPDLSQYGAELLAALGLPEDCYRVDEVVWDGEAYEQDGVLCRNALAKGEKLIRNVEVRYGGQVRTPEVQGKRYIGIYEELLPETEAEPETGEAEESAAETAPAVPESIPEAASAAVGAGERLAKWLMEHLTVVTFGAGFFLFLLAVVLLLWKTEKNESDGGRRKRK